MEFVAEIVAALSDPVEFAGLVLGLAAVVLLIRQSIWTWPVGLAYALISVWVFSEAKLYADLLLHVFYVAMNLYGWWYWLKTPADGPTQTEVTTNLAVSRSPNTLLLRLLGIGFAGSLLMGWYFDTHTDADYAYADSATTAFSFVAMWMQARKLLESWVLWFLIDVVAVALYTVKGLNYYALLYAVYLGLAIIGWRAWRQTINP